MYNQQDFSSFYDETNNDLKKLKLNKAAGIDNVINEFIISSQHITADLITKFFNVILNTGTVPSEWTIGIICPIFKNKGSPLDPGNYRGITILSCLGKLFTSIINDRLSDYLEKFGILGEEQAGFRHGYSTLDHIFNLKSIIDIYLSKRKKLFCAFVDYAKAFDTVNRSHLWKKLIQIGINGKVLKIIINMYNNAKSCVKSNLGLLKYINYNIIFYLYFVIFYY